VPNVAVETRLSQTSQHLRRLGARSGCRAAANGGMYVLPLRLQKASVDSRKTVAMEFQGPVSSQSGGRVRRTRPVRVCNTLARVCHHDSLGCAVC